MAKGARASTKKANNARLKSGIFGPVESARNERLSAKLLALATKPKPKKEDVVMGVEGASEENGPISAPDQKHPEGMEVDGDALKDIPLSKPRRLRIEKKRSSRRASIVFPKYKKGPKAGKSKGK